jgi:diguanylate cyclase
MRNEVANLSDSVRQSADLAELQSNVLGSVDRMQAHVRTHLEEENARRAEAEDEAGKLRTQLRRLEQDTFDLRRQVAQAYQDAMLDPLTRLPNRRAYDERIAQEFARWKRFAEPLALMILDVDDFKVVNDTFGHNSGDKALSMIGAILVDRMRETDFIARYGGEEFVVLLSGADQENARRLADDLRVAVENGGLHANRQPVRITVSVGLAAFADGDAPEQVFERADQALYAAKQQGKNRVVAG